MSILVTGASGQFGRSAAERLLDAVPASEVIARHAPIHPLPAITAAARPPG